MMHAVLKELENNSGRPQQLTPFHVRGVAGAVGEIVGTVPSAYTEVFFAHGPFLVELAVTGSGRNTRVANAARLLSRRLRGA